MSSSYGKSKLDGLCQGRREGWGAATSHAVAEEEQGASDASTSRRLKSM